LNNPKSLSQYRASNLAKWAAWIIFYACTGTFLLQHFSGPAGASPIWLPAGIGLGILLIYGWRHWPIVFLGATLAEIGGGHTFFMSVALAFGALLGNFIAYVMLWMARFDRKLISLKDNFLLILVSALAAIASTLINFEFLKMGGLIAGDELETYTKWYFGDFFGMAFFTPVLLVLYQPWPDIWSNQKKVIFCLLFLGMVIFGQAIFFGWFTDIFGNISGRANLLFLAVILFGFYFGRHGVILLFTLFLIQSSLSTIYGTGFFGLDMQGQPAPIYIWFYLALMSMAGLMVSLAVRNINIKNKAINESAAAIIKSEGYFKEMVRKTPLLISAFDFSFKKLDFINPYFTHVLGYSADDLINIPTFLSTAFPETTARNKIMNQIEGKSIHDIEVSEASPVVEAEVRCKDGELKTIAWGFFKTENNLVIYGQDITDQKRSQNLLNVTSAVYQAMGEAVVIHDEGNHILVVNEAFCRLTGYGEQELIGRPIYDLFASSESGKLFFSEIRAALDSLGRWEGQVVVLAKNGERIPRFMSMHSTYGDQGALSQRVALISEVTDYRKAHELIVQQANFDPLTQLPNRRLLLELLDKSIKEAHNKKQCIAVVYLDIDNFKSANDSRGHDFGDQLLISFSKRLREVIRSYDVVARIGGDEFVIILNNLQHIEEIDAIMQGISSALAEPLYINDEIIYTTSSLGISVFPEHADNSKSLLLAADQAMYVAKSIGRNNYQFFSTTLKDDAFYRAAMLTELRRALELKEFELFYQPIFDLETNTLAHAEALLRWRRASGELVLPSNFINESEESGLIIELGDWVMNEVITLMSSIQHKQGFSMAINVSALQLSSVQHSALNWLSLIKAAGLKPDCITFEITERIMLAKSERVLNKVALLQAEGCKFSIDDFGTGYSSLGALKSMNFDYVKIDGGFINKLPQKGPDASMVIAMIAMAKALGLKTIAEGVETAEQAKIVKEMGCSYGQGYFYGEPLPESEFRRLLLG
jgi:diguanylate cyclase (GGDEF)-like protein/PAS domain S-box-containing protein